MNAAVNSLHWFRKGLRLHDNPSLRQAIEGSSTFRAVFFLDVDSLNEINISRNKWRFLLDCLLDLDCSLRKLNSRLFIVRGQPIDVFPKLIKQWNITRVTFECDGEPFPQRRDDSVKRLLESQGVEVLVSTSHTLYNIDEVVELNHGNVPVTFKQFECLVSKLRSPDSCVPDIDQDLFENCKTPVADDHDNIYGVPQYGALDLEEEEHEQGEWVGGEKEALRRLALLEKEVAEPITDSAQQEKNSPFPKSSKLSPYLRFGCLSVKYLFHRMNQVYKEVHGKPAPLSVHLPLLWREFFFVVASRHRNFDKMRNNSLCLQFPWEEHADYLEHFKQGKTGFPWIDAIMRQLVSEGWIPHLARQAVGCFLTRGALWICWEEGFKIFEKFMLDAEWSINAGCWMWLSCSAFFAKHPQWMCPVGLGEHLDPQGNYVRKYVPELKDFPSEYIYEPWKAPLETQRTANCIVGDDYPQPIINHQEARRDCIQKLRGVYQNLVSKVSSNVGLGHNAMHWFRKDLRLHDNPSLCEALTNCRTFHAVYIIDPVSARAASVSANRWKFLLDCLNDLDKSLRECGSRLHVIRGQPTYVLPKLFQEWNISKLTFECEIEPFGQRRDVAVAVLGEEHGVEVISKPSHTLYDPEKIIDSNEGEAPLLIKTFENVVRQMGPPEKPVDAVNKEMFTGCICPVSTDYNTKFSVPHLDELGFKDEDVTTGELWVGGEQEAIKRLTELEEKVLIGNLKKSVEGLDALQPSRTQLSPYLRFGCLSPRLFHMRLTKAYMKVKCQPPPLSLYRQLVWREFFFTLASQNPNMDKAVDNPLSLNIPWEDNKKALDAWKKGQTGFPWIDAIMRQLHAEGWIHHVARQAVGCFLTRGCLWISWEEGFKLFEELQLDSEWSLNAGNWLWVSCSAFFHGQIPWYCPVNVGKKLDPTGNFIRRYVPELKTMPTKYIHEPWLAPMALQKASNCIVGQDYPERLCDHIERRKVCLQRLKEVCQQIKGTKSPSKDKESTE
ncbi:hypothetical protein ACROYT_G017620 [Oculina patagonica]